MIGIVDKVNFRYGNDAAMTTIPIADWSVADAEPNTAVPPHRPVIGTASRELRCLSTATSLVKPFQLAK
jgi:hypothetical protein